MFNDASKKFGNIELNCFVGKDLKKIYAYNGSLENSWKMHIIKSCVGFQFFLIHNAHIHKILKHPHIYYRCFLKIHFLVSKMSMKLNSV